MKRTIRAAEKRRQKDRKIRVVFRDQVSNFDISDGYFHEDWSGGVEETDTLGLVGFANLHYALRPRNVVDHNCYLGVGNRVSEQSRFLARQLESPSVPVRALSSHRRLYSYKGSEGGNQALEDASDEDRDRVRTYSTSSTASSLSDVDMYRRVSSDLTRELEREEVC